MALKQIQSIPFQPQYHEDILVVKRNLLFQQTQAWQGLQKEPYDTFLRIIQQHAAFIPRTHAETDPTYKQIIPYMVFVYDKKIFVMKRKSTASEQRLSNKYSLGIGGHMRQEDIKNNDILFWGQREFHEEVTYHDRFNTIPLGILNDDSSEIGKVHLGIALLLQGNSCQIAIKDEHKSGVLLTLEQCYDLYPLFEPWSQMLLPALKNYLV